MKESIEKGAEFFIDRRLLHDGEHFARWWWLRYRWHYFYDVLVGLDFMTALGYGRDPRMGRPSRISRRSAFPTAAGSWTTRTEIS